VFGVVKSLSPAKILFAPAKKHNACASKLILTLPADNRTMVLGIMILVTAIILVISQVVTSG
jgi:hypothetical protein